MKIPLLALVGDPNSHGAGELQTPPQTVWTVGGKLVTTVDTVAAADTFVFPPHPSGPTNASSGSSKWTVAGKAIHRHGDSRYCGATTVVGSQTKITIGA